MLRTLLAVSFILLALIAPVWIPAPVVRVLATRPYPTRREDDAPIAGRQREA
jgi:hypothetical protein